MHDGLTYFTYDLVALAAHLFLTFGFSLRTEGRNNVPKSGRVLLIANHQSGLDPFLVGAATSRHVRFLARKTLFTNWFVRWMFDTHGVVPIDQEGVGKEGLRAILHQLTLEQTVVVFPEGTRSDDGIMQPFKPGVQLLINRAKPVIVPIGIAGAFHAWPYWRPYPIPSPLFLPPGKSTIAVSVGQPLDGQYYAQLPRKQLLSELFDKVATQVRSAEQLRRKFPGS